ncbi:MAG: DUF3168 domain-containing protein [Parvibaculum sp.]|uniref:DUF3168 domain-containing protein n=1 Tax=Parvibaculum sp. TaxID=2024848 RepID=UPI0025E12A7A|nr:DUF3168 domain-containing protein [Parvibaculum sp.]MCE9650577.1 DUF3168 domain-containing protein [Parvibaculum sp.]
MMDADLALQKAIYARLADDAALAAFVGARIYDNVPGDTGFPYLTLGEATVDDWSDGGAAGAEHRLAFNAYTRGGGRAEAKAIMGAVNAALHDADLTLDGHHLVNLRFIAAETRREADGATWRGTIRFRAVTERITA